MVRQNVSYLFSVIAGWRAYAGAEIPAGCGEIAYIDTAGPKDDVTKRERIVQVLVNLLVFFGAGLCGISGGVEDAGKGRHGNAGAAYDEPLEQRFFEFPAAGGVDFGTSAARRKLRENQRRAIRTAQRMQPDR